MVAVLEPLIGNNLDEISISASGSQMLPFVMFDKKVSFLPKVVLF